MPQDVSTMINAAAFAGAKPAAAFAVLDPSSESLADGIGQSYGIIGYKGKVWTLRLRGETHRFNRPDDGTPSPFLDVIVLRSPTYKSKSYYPAGTFQDGQVGLRPVCAALDGVTPDVDITTPQAPVCAVCPRNVFKINAEGRKTRDCSDYKRLSVLVLPKMTKDLLGAPLMEPVFLRVPAASLNELAKLGENMEAQGFHFSTYITRIGFDPEKPHPQMTFRALQPLTDNQAPLVLPMREDPQSLRITGESEVGNKARPAAITIQQDTSNVVPIKDPAIEAAAAKAQALAAAKAQADAAAKAQAEAAAKAQAEAAALVVDTGFGDTEAAPTVVKPVVKPVVAAAPVDDTGFGDVAAGVVTAAAPVANAVADVGVVEDADADLDARVMALLPK